MHHYGAIQALIWCIRLRGPCAAQTIMRLKKQKWDACAEKQAAPAKSALACILLMLG
jgi:hypothetical protein